MFLLLLLSGFLSALSYYWYAYEKHFSVLGKLPGPPRKFLLGNLVEFRDNIVDSFNTLIDLPVRYGPQVRLWLGPFRRAVIVTDPADVEYFLTSSEHIDKSPSYADYLSWLGNGLINSTGDYWKKHRKMISPSFHVTILEEFTNNINANCNHLVEILSRNTRCNYNISPIISLYTLDVICETAMNVKINAMDNKNLDYLNALNKFMEIHLNRSFSVIKQNDTLFKFTSDYKERMNCIKTLHSFTANIIKQRKEERITSQQNDCTNEFSIRKKTGFLDLLLDMKDLTDQELREEVDTFMLAGHDSVSSAISFALFELAKYPEIQERLYEESVELFGNGKLFDINFRNVQEMKYLDMVVKECFRIKTPIPSLERQVKRTVIHNNVEYPAGTIISILPYAMHMNPKLFPNPNQFDPDRFLPDNCSRRHAFAYIPFSAGPRNCIGQRFAVLETKLTVIKIIRSFKLSAVVPVFTPKLRNDASLKSLNGLPIVLQMRE